MSIPLVIRALMEGVRAYTAQLTYDANATNQVFYVNGSNRSVRVRAITARVQAAGTDAADVTATIRRLKPGVALADGEDLHETPFDLKGEADALQRPDLDRTPGLVVLPPGAALGIVFDGDLTAASGVIAVDVIPTVEP